MNLFGSSSAGGEQKAAQSVKLCGLVKDLAEHLQGAIRDAQAGLTSQGPNAHTGG